MEREQIRSTSPMGESLPQNILFAGSTMIWKETAPLRPRRPDHCSHNGLLKRTYPLTLVRSNTLIKKQRQTLSLELAFSHVLLRKGFTKTFCLFAMFGFHFRQRLVQIRGPGFPKGTNWSLRVRPVHLFLYLSADFGICIVVFFRA